LHERNGIDGIDNKPSRSTTYIGISHATRKSIPFSFALDQREREIAEVERHTYFQLPVTYRAESYYPSYATHTLNLSITR